MCDCVVKEFPGREKTGRLPCGQQVHVVIALGCGSPSGQSHVGSLLPFILCLDLHLDADFIGAVRNPRPDVLFRKDSFVHLDGRVSLLDVDQERRDPGQQQQRKPDPERGQNRKEQEHSDERKDREKIPGHVVQPVELRASWLIELLVRTQVQNSSKQKTIFQMAK